MDTRPTPTANTPREYTKEEAREILLRHVHTLITYWEREDRVPSVHDKLEGLAHSIFATLDGSTLATPAFEVRPIVRPTDKDYHISQGENWFPAGVDVGPFHEVLHHYRPTK